MINNNNSFLHTDAWETFQRALGRTTYRASGDKWSYLAIKEHGAGNTRLYTPYGPSFSSLAAFDAAITSLKTTAKNANATFIRIEPTDTISPDELRRRGFRPVTYQQLQPRDTLCIDLTRSSDELLADMSQNSRNITKNITKKGVTFRRSTDPNDIPILLSLLHAVAQRNHITVHSDEYFRTQAATLFPSGAASLFIAEYESTPIAAALVYDSDTTRTYAHAAADDTYRKLSAGTGLVGHMILDAQANGLSFFDLYGITLSDDPRHPWAGFTKFKRSFGGVAVSYPGAWDLPLKPLPYLVYRTYQTINHWRRSHR